MTKLKLPMLLIVMLIAIGLVGALTVLICTVSVLAQPCIGIAGMPTTGGVPVQIWPGHVYRGAGQERQVTLQVISPQPFQVMLNGSSLPAGRIRSEGKLVYFATFQVQRHQRWGVKAERLMPFDVTAISYLKCS